MSRTYVTVLRRGDRLAWRQSHCEPFCNLCHRMPCGRSGHPGTLAGAGSTLPQVRLDDLECDRRCGVGAEAAALHDDADRYLRVVRWRETGEDRVIEVRIVHAVLCGSGLCCALDRCRLGTGGRIGGAVGILRDAF